MYTKHEVQRTLTQLVQEHRKQSIKVHIRESTKFTEVRVQRYKLYITGSRKKCRQNLSTRNLVLQISTREAQK